MDLNATSPDSPAPGSFWRQGLLVFLAVLVLSVPQAAMLPLLDRDEPRFAEASREMLQSGNFIVPTFNHAPRYAKPPLIYWCQTVSYSLFGENAFAARLPSLLATAGTAVILALWGAQLGSATMGMIAALCYAFCLQTIQQGRVATADALLIFFMTLTVFAGWKILTATHDSHRSRSYFWDTLLALGFAGGFLAKGPEALLPVFPLLYCARGIRGNLIGEVLVNFVLGLIIVSFWAIPAYLMTNGDYWREGLNEGIRYRIFSGLQGHGASTFGWYLLGIPLYLLLFWLSALPWSPLLVIHRKKLITAWKPDLVDTYLLLNVGLIFLVFSLMVTKLPHYTLPAFPFIALLLARRWISVGLRPSLPIKLSAGFGILLALATLIVVPLYSRHTSLSAAGTLIQKSRDVLSPDSRFAIADFQEPSAIWEIRRISKAYVRLASDVDAMTFLNLPGPRAFMLSTPQWQELQANKAGIDPSWKVYETTGLNSAKGNVIDLTLIVKP